MTVKELIELLEECPEDALIKMDEEDELVDVTGLTLRNSKTIRPGRKEDATGIVVVLEYGFKD